MVYSLKVPLTFQQKKIMKMFYAVKAHPVVLDCCTRNTLWKKIKENQLLSNDEIAIIKNKCPAIQCELNKSIRFAHNLQSAVFSECVYAQTLANIFGLNIFINFQENETCLDNWIMRLLASYFLIPRYIYKNEQEKMILIQAGSCRGVDSALISVVNKEVFTIEFKEVGAKTSEVDLPKYKEDGYLLINDVFKGKYPQFISMVEEQVEKKMSFFEKMGSNINDFSSQSIQSAVVNNYNNSKKYADVICTEDKNGYLTMIPANQSNIWAEMAGEIRPAGRNSCRVWTPNALRNYILELGGKIDESNNVIFGLHQIRTTCQRGGKSGKISRYKINSIFFVRHYHCIVDETTVRFRLEDVKQLIPTISAKVFFGNLDVECVRNYYQVDFNE